MGKKINIKEKKKKRREGLQKPEKKKEAA